MGFSRCKYRGERERGWPLSRAKLWALLNNGMILQKMERGSNTHRDRFIPGISNATSTEPIKTLPNPGPVDQPMREFLGDDAAIMAGLNPFINDLT